MLIKESGQMYLEAIFVLSESKKKIRAIDVGAYLGYSKPSVSRAIGILKREEYITLDEDGYITLTKRGEEIAKKLYERHTVLANLLIALGVDEKTATEDACRIEHVISEESFAAVKSHIKNLTK